MYLDYAEDQAERQQPMDMKDWMNKLHAFLQFNECEILKNAGILSKIVVEDIATKEYENLNKHRFKQPSHDDFERFVENKSLKK